MADHRTLLSTDVHEPKHISDSTSADAGKVITPTLGGQSELRYLTAADVGILSVYGEAAVDANTDPFSVPAAVDTTLYTTSDYVQLNSVRIPLVYLDQSGGVTFNASTNGLVPSVSGVYRVTFWMNVATSIANSKIGVKCKKNGLWANFTVKHDIKDTGRVQVMMGHILTDLVAGDPVTFWMASDKAASLTIQDLRYTIELIQGA